MQKLEIFQNKIVCLRCYGNGLVYEAIKVKKMNYYWHLLNQGNMSWRKKLWYQYFAR